MSQPDFEDSVFVEFYNDAVELVFESEKEGRPIFKDVPFVRILIPGDTNNIIERVANVDDRKKYAKAWSRFQSNEIHGVQGTPIEQWPQITRAQIKEAKYFEVHNVEQMSSLSDTAIMRMGMGFSNLRDKAKAYLAVAAGTAEATKDAADKARLQAEIDDLKEQMKSMGRSTRSSRVKADELVEAVD
jgi:hypothetical protein